MLNPEQFIHLTIGSCAIETALIVKNNTSFTWNIFEKMVFEHVRTQWILANRNIDRLNEVTVRKIAKEYAKNFAIITGREYKEDE